jgi:AraC-like DNA-binding protein
LGCAVSGIACGSGPKDAPFEEQHESYSISFVLQGSFQYRSAQGREVMIPGSVLLGNAGQCFECSHQHGVGDYCVSFQYEPRMLASIAESEGIPFQRFKRSRVPALKATSELSARIQAALVRGDRRDWDDLSLQVAGTMLELQKDGFLRTSSNPPAAEARITKVVRAIENNLDADLSLASLAREAGLSPFHCLRLFQHLTGVTPHQYIRRLRIRRAATLLAATESKVIDIAAECGFEDVSNFNRAFHAEFGMNPRRFRSRS